MIDIVLAVLLVGYVVAGCRSGLITSALSLVGFFGGAVLGSLLAGKVAPHIAGGTARFLATIVMVVAVAAVGQGVAVAVGRAARARMTWRPARAVDTVLGGLLSALAVLLVAWMVAVPLASSALFPGVSSAVRGSRLLRGVDSAMPQQVRTLYSSARDAVDRGHFPDVFGALVPTRVRAVNPPDPAVLADPDIARSVRSVVKITGSAPSCSRRIEGSGFVIAAHRVLTNAHVVAGVTDAAVRAGDQVDAARVVLYDPHLDVAILDVPDLSAAALSFSSSPAAAGADSVIAGFPEDGPLFVGAARVRDQQQVHGPDIYGNSVTRDVYALRGDVRPGNSGGPLLRPDGSVYGVIFAAAVDQRDTGYALTADAVADDAALGRTATTAVGTESCAD